MLAKPSFDQYVALEHSLEEAGGAIQMFHPQYLVPQAHYACLGTRGKTGEKLDTLQDNLEKVRGVRSAIVDSDRWFTNEQGIDVGGVVIFADTTPELELDLIAAGKKAGFILQPNDHGHNNREDDKWSEMNHAFAGLCLLLLTVIGVMQLNVPRPGWFIKYGTAFVWLAMFVFLFIRSDRNSWPLGPLSWWEGFREWETVQHRMGIGLLLLIAVGDFMRIRNGWKINPTMGRWGVLVIGVAGSVMLYTHLHSSLDPAHARIVTRMNGEHIAMATACLGFAVSKFAWDTWQLPRKGGAYVWLGFLGALGLILNFYVE